MNLPEYHTHFKNLPPLRDGKVINLKYLCNAINEVTPEKNYAELSNDSIIINNVEVQLTYGIAALKSTKFRFRFLGELLHNLRKEKLFYATDAEIEEIQFFYKKL